MGLRLIRIGNKVRVGEVKSLSFRRSMRNSAVILYMVALWVIYIVVRRAVFDILYRQSRAQKAARCTRGE